MLIVRIQKKMIQKTYLKTKDLCKVKFTVRMDGAERIEILGLNDNWETPVAMGRKRDGNFSYEVTLPKNSQHEFKYLVNGHDWRNEPDADGEVPNQYGGTNSLLVL